MKKISLYIILVLLACSLPLSAQNRQPKAPTDSVVFRGFSVHADVASPLMGLVIDKGILAGEAQFDINLLNRFFPIVEVGFASANVTTANSTHYRTNAPFWRIGLNYNIIRTKTNDAVEKVNKNYPFIGLRYGMSVLNFEMDNVPYAQEYWGEQGSMSLSKRNAYVGWAELVGGVRVDLAKGFTMGWSVRAKMLLHSSLSDKEQMWFVPGYGRSSGVQFTLNYTIGFTYRTKWERHRMAMAPTH